MQPLLQSANVTQKKRPRACLFCGNVLTGVRSQEHVFPQWILDDLEIRDKQFSAVHVFRPPDPDSEPEVLKFSCSCA